MPLVESALRQQLLVEELGVSPACRDELSNPPLVESGTAFLKAMGTSTVHAGGLLWAHSGVPSPSFPTGVSSCGMDGLQWGGLVFRGKAEWTAEVSSRQRSHFPLLLVSSAALPPPPL